MKHYYLLLLWLCGGFVQAQNWATPIAATQFLVLDKTETKDLPALITQLQTEVEELRQKWRCLAENDFVTNENK